MKKYLIHIDDINRGDDLILKVGYNYWRGSFRTYISKRALVVGKSNDCILVCYHDTPEVIDLINIYSSGVMIENILSSTIVNGVETVNPPM